MILSIFGSSVYKYRFYSISQIIVEFKEYNNFLFFILLKLQNNIRLSINHVKVTISEFFVSYKNILNAYIVFLYEKVKDSMK